MTESEFRDRIQSVYARVEAAFEDVDPDVVECEAAQGALTLTFANGIRWVVSAQPPVRQLWLALASRGEGLHFRYEAESGRWIEEKQQLELYAYLCAILEEETGLQLRF